MAEAPGTIPAVPSIPDHENVQDTGIIPDIANGSILGSPNQVTRFIITTVDRVRTRSLDQSSSSLPAATKFSPPSAATPISLPSQSTQHSSSSTVETTKLIIGLAVAITVLVLLVTIGLASFYIVRKRRRKKTEAITPEQDLKSTKGERYTPQMYLQQKVELDDEQRRHEIEATDASYELEGADKIYEMPAGRCGRPELSGEDRSKGLDKPS